ncbi:hypothetical protein [Pseudomonas solani]|uniref:hypothetical protein n=1 Tax=Pseudomonas solani TaxID=2731552 RepID=UPI003D6A29B6
MWVLHDSIDSYLFALTVILFFISTLLDIFNAVCRHISINGALMSRIPPKLQNPGDPQKKFLTAVSTSEFLTLQKEAADRGIDLLTLTGSVLSLWVSRGCPLDFSGNDQVLRD